MVLSSLLQDYPGGPELSEKAKQIAVRLCKSNFKASHGWLDKWGNM